MQSWLDKLNVGDIISAFALIITVIIYFKTRKFKSLGYEIIAFTPLLSVDKGIQGKIKVSYEDMPVRDLSLLLIKFLNNGSEPITSADFEQPITMSFDPEVRILSAEITEVNPLNIDGKIKLEPNRIVAAPLLLNKNDYIIIRILLTGSKDIKIDPSARIIGVKKIKKITSGNRLNARQLTAISLILFWISIYKYLSMIYPENYPPYDLIIIEYWDIIIGLGPIMIIIVTALILLIYKKESD